MSVSMEITATDFGDLRLLKSSSGAWHVEHPYDVDLFANAPDRGPYATLAEAQAAATVLRMIVSGAGD